MIKSSVLDNSCQKGANHSLALTVTRLALDIGFGFFTFEAFTVLSEDKTLAQVLWLSNNGVVDDMTSALLSSLVEEWSQSWRPIEVV